MVWKVTADVDRFDEAAEWFGSRIPVAADKLDELNAEERQRAFKLAGVTELEVVQTVHGSILEAINEGKPFDQWKREIRKELDNRWEPDGWLLETIFRTNVQTAYNTGRYYQLTDPEVVSVRPFLLFDAVDDSRTTQICRDRDGVVKAHDDPYIHENYPPLHHRCRSAWRTIRRSEADELGGATPSTKDPKTAPSEGFGLSPPRRGEVDPRQDRFGEDLWTAYRDRQTDMSAHERHERIRREEERND